MARLSGPRARKVWPKGLTRLPPLVRPLSSRLVLGTVSSRADLLAVKRMMLRLGEYPRGHSADDDVSILEVTAYAYASAPGTLTAGTFAARARH
jgi:hypothetical protein